MHPTRHTTNQKNRSLNTKDSRSKSRNVLGIEHKKIRGKVVNMANRLRLLIRETSFGKNRPGLYERTEDESPDTSLAKKERPIVQPHRTARAQLNVVLSKKLFDRSMMSEETAFSRPGETKRIKKLIIHDRGCQMNDTTFERTEKQYVDEGLLEHYSQLIAGSPNIQALTASIKQYEHQPTNMNLYDVIKSIGKGSFGNVDHAKQILTGLDVAIKSVNKRGLNIFDEDAKKVQNEIRILRAVSKLDRVVKFYELVETKDNYYLVMQYCTGGDLLKYLKQKGVMKESDAKPIVFDVALALKQLHAANVIHRDVKLDNIMIDKEGRGVLGDLGISKELADGEILYDDCGTPAYLSPEMIKKSGNYGYAADVWALGITVYALVFGRVPFKSSNSADLYNMILNNPLTFPTQPDVSEDLKDLLSLMLEKNESNRISAESLFLHPWLKGQSQPSVSAPSTGLQRTFKSVIQLFGYSVQHLEHSLKNGLHNHCTSCYFNLLHHHS